MLRNYKNRNDGRHTADETKRMAQMELRISVRKATALSKMGKVPEAITEYERAQKMDPGNPQIGKDLNALRRM